MNTYVITYDLPEGSDYGPLYEAIKSYGTWAHITESTWAIVTSQPAGHVRDDLGSHVPAGGRLFVVRTGGQAAWRNVICTNTWLKEKL